MVAARIAVNVSIVLDVITVTTANTARTATGAGLVSTAGIAQDVLLVPTVRTASIALAVSALSAKLVGSTTKPRSNKMYGTSHNELRRLIGDCKQGVSGDGPLAAEWKDKPHRLVYDLCHALEVSLARYEELYSAYRATADV